MNNKIFVIGSNKTGTTSLTKSLTTLGFNVCPEYCYQPDSKILKNFQEGLYEELFDLVDKFDAFEDRPWNHTDFYKILDNKYPNSKFILTIRDTDNWINSVKKWGNKIGEINPDFYTIVSQTCYGVDSYLSEESVVTTKYNERNLEIINYFKDKGNLLVIDVEKGDGWQKICQFLECEIPNVPFPYLNKNLYGNSPKDPVYGYLENPRELLFIDMDGVLADAEAGMKVWSDKLGLSTDELFKKKLYHMPGFYLDLPPMEGAVEAFKKLAKKYEVYILTAPSWENPSCYTDKRLWVEKYLGDAAYKRLIISNDKSLFTGRALIDDRMKYGVTKFKGEHIHFGSEKFPGWESILNYL